jgi:hypothetical protein
MEAAGTSETPVNFCEIPHSNIPEDSHLLDGTGFRIVSDGEH